MKNLPVALSLLTPLLASGPALAQATSYSLPGAAAGDACGRSVATVGDVDQDGVDDFVVGTPGANPNGSDSGRAALYSGRDRRVLHAWTGAAAGEEAGFAVAGAGDVDGDGIPDVVVGAPGAVQGGVALGKAVLLSGADGNVLRTLWGTDPGSRFGAAVAGMGDVDGDGHADVAVGAPLEDWFDTFNQVLKTDAGVARSFSGSTGAVLITLNGSHSGAHSGTAVGAFRNAPSGVCYLASGAPEAWGKGSVVFQMYNFPLGAAVDGTTTGGKFGSSYAQLGDLNGDGADDFAVGAPLDSTGGANAGRVHFFDGWLWSPLYGRSGAAGDRLGQSLAVTEDVDGDGLSDLLAGAPTASLPVLGAYGKAYVVSATGTLLTSCAGPTQGSRFGDSVAAGDFNGDGVMDALVGAPDDGPNGSGSGSAQIVLFANSAGSPYCYGDGSGTPCPCAASPVGGRSGCPNTTGNAGKLVGTGVARTANDTVVLQGTGLPNSTCLLFQGSVRVNGGDGAPYADGLRCAGGSVKRLAAKAASLGAVTFPSAGGPSISSLGGAQPGQTLHYQVWYRDAAPGFCTSGTTNFTNGFSIAWQP